MKNFLWSFVHAAHGLWVGFDEHRNLKVQTGVAVATMFAGLYLHISSVDWCIILLCIGLVLSLELVNSALEELVNLTMPERMPLAGKVKDLAAGAVLLFSFVSLLVGIILFRKYLIQ